MKERIAKERAAMLKEAMSRPGVREVMEVYQSWKKTDGSLDNYRRMNKKGANVVVSDNANSV